MTELEDELRRRAETAEAAAEQLIEERIQLKALASMVDLRTEERDDLREQLEAITAMAGEYKHALEHVANCGGTCQDCRRLARSALAHENLSDFRLHAVHRTKTGKVLTDADIVALADEAEQGYDVSHLVNAPRRVRPDDAN